VLISFFMHVKSAHNINTILDHECAINLTFERARDAVNEFIASDITSECALKYVRMPFFLHFES
jgi:hypothetical protein